MDEITTPGNVESLRKDVGHRMANDAALEQVAENGVGMPSTELDLMKKIAGAAALLVARLDRVSLPGGTAVAALALAGLIEGMPEDLMSEVTSLFKSS